jgi:hypothetical protein
MVAKATDRVGQTNYNSFGTLMKIVEYKNNKNVIVEFQDEYKYQKKVRYSMFLNGIVFNPYDKATYNFGYFGVGEYKSEEKRKMTKAYSTWTGMIQRCYDPYFINYNKPTYKDCFVCEEWANYQNFAQWFEENYYEVPGEKMQLDKDILIKNNKIYSPDTCVFVPQRINSLFIKANKARGDLPIGLCKRQNKIEVRCSTIENGKQ